MFKFIRNLMKLHARTERLEKELSDLRTLYEKMWNETHPQTF